MQTFAKMFIPKSFTCFVEGYSTNALLDDVKAGITVGIIALPLAMAFAIGAGVTPAAGLVTAVIAGFLISLFGGSRVQIGGPTGAFVVLVYATLQKHGMDGLILATFLAGCMMIVMGILRLGAIIRYIPYPVITGFTAGIATVIFASQIKDFFGLELHSETASFTGKLASLWQVKDTLNPFALAISILSLGIIISLRSVSKKIPGTIVAIIAATLLTTLFDLPVSTIESKFGQIPQAIPMPAFPHFSFELLERILPDAFAIALLGAIESLLSCVVADRMTERRHKSNCELVGQGIANIGSSLFGGIPATGAIARTTANIQMGAKTPVSGMIHAITLFCLMYLFAPLASKIPLGALAAILMWVAYNMSELDHCINIIKGPKNDAFVLVITFILTVLIDLAFAVQIGVLLSALIFLKQMSEKTALTHLSHQDEVTHFELEGPLFFGAATVLNKALDEQTKKAKSFHINMRHVPFIDASGLNALKQFHKRCLQSDISLYLSDVRPDVLPSLQEVGLGTLAGGSTHTSTA